MGIGRFQQTQPMPPLLSTRPVEEYPRTAMAGARDPMIAALIQIIEEQKQKEQQKAQLLQAFGFGQNPLPMGAIPRGHGIMTMDGQAFTRPAGSDPKTMQLISALLGLNVNEMSASGINRAPSAMSSPTAAGTFGFERPNPVAEQPGLNDKAYATNRMQTARADNDQMLIDFLLRNYGGVL